MPECNWEVLRRPIVDCVQCDSFYTELSKAAFKLTKETPLKKNEENQADKSYITPRDVKRENLLTQDQNGTGIEPVNSINNTSLINIQSGGDLIRPKEEPNSTSLYESSLPRTSREKSIAQSNLPLSTEESNRSVTREEVTLCNKISLTHHLSACGNLSNQSIQQAKCDAPKLIEDDKSFHSCTGRLNQLIIEARLKPLKIILHDCMKTKNYSVDVEQPSKMEREKCSTRLRKRPLTEKFEDGDDGNSCSNFPDDEDQCSDWELDYTSSWDNNLDFKSIETTHLNREHFARSKTSNDATEIQFISEVNFSDTKSKAMLPNLYKKHTGTEINLACEQNSDSSVFIQLSKKSKSDVNNVLNQHITEEQNDSKDLPQSSFMCLVCKKIFLSRSSFSNHKRTLCFGKTRVSKFQCDICGKLYPRQTILDDHKSSHRNERTYNCQDCDKSFNSVNARKLHHAKVHKKILTDKKYLCTFCGMTTKSTEHLRAHEKTHLLPQGASVLASFKCLQCGKGFISNFKLKSHLREHYPHKCKQCGRKYSSIELLENHKKRHVNINIEFKCEICSKTFARQKSLYIHKKYAHVSTLQFFCDICDKGFKQKHHVEQHMITHSDERPISCTVCTETFKRKTHLKQHMAAFHKKGKEQPL